MQSAEQPQEQTRSQSRPYRGAGPWGWRPGQSGNPAGREGRARRQQRIGELVTEWSGGRALEPVQRDLVRRAAELFLYARPNTIEDQARIANTIGRLVAQAGLANARRPILRKPVHVPLRDRLAAEAEAAALAAENGRG